MQRLGPGHRRVWVNAEAWRRGFETLPEVRLNFEELRGGIRRDEMIQAVAHAVSAGRFVDAFVVCMMWGYGPSGYGPYRTRRVLEQAKPGQSRKGVVAEVSRALADGADLAMGTEPAIERARRGFWYFNNVKADEATGTPGGYLRDFGPAFFTKWLSATSAGGDPGARDALPILDAVIAGWWQAEVDKSFNPRRTDHYVNYVNQLIAWRDELSDTHKGLTLMRIEEAIFEFVQRGGVESPSGIDTGAIFLD